MLHTFHSLATLLMTTNFAAALALAIQTAPRSALTVSQLGSIAPSSTTCAGAPHPSECRTAGQALPYILESFSKYSIDSTGAQAALLSTMAFESAEFKYQKNYFPGNPGQGTRNMQSAEFNLQYAQSIPELTNQLSAAEASGPNGARDLLISNDAWDFGSAAWFLATQCGEEVKSGLAQGGPAAFTAYIGCIGTTLTDERQEYWQKATAALG